MYSSHGDLRTLFSFFSSISISMNPLAVKRFIQAHLKRSKTDKVDAQGIAEYGKRMDFGNQRRLIFREYVSYMYY